MTEQQFRTELMKRRIQLKMSRHDLQLASGVSRASIMNFENAQSSLSIIKVTQILRALALEIKLVDAKSDK